jgi:hypothetical protein
VKSFGRRQAYESPRGRNPRGTVGGYGDFELRPMSVMARRPLGSVGRRCSRTGLAHEGFVRSDVIRG